MNVAIYLDDEKAYTTNKQYIASLGLIMDESFHFALLRISIAQILKASGFDKCKPSILNILTDIYIQYFRLLLSRTLKFSNQRVNCNDIGIQDITQAMLDIGFIKPSSFENYLDAYDILKHHNHRDKDSNVHKEYNTKSMDSFIDWLKYSDSFSTSQKLSEVPREYIKNLIDKRKLDDSAETDQDKKKRKLREKQEFYNHFKSTLSTDLPNEENEEEISKQDQLSWLDYLAEKDLKLGHDLKFLSTSLEPQLISLQNNERLHPIPKSKRQQILQHINNVNKNDHVLINLEQDEENAITPPTDLLKVLPYNLKYDKNLLDDDLDLYFEYFQKHNQHNEDPETHEHDHEHDHDHEQDHGTDHDGILVNDDGIGGDNKLML